jgi:hypothetical protein
MKSNKLDIRFGILALVVLVAGMSRLLPHPPNVSPLSAVALFGGAYFTKRWQSVLLPILAYWVSDLVLNNVVYKAFFPTFTLFSVDFYFVTVSLLLMSALSWVLLKVVKVQNVLTASIISSLIFFVITNFGSWINWKMYPMNAAGLTACYVAGLPYLLNTMIGDLLWSAILFGGFALAQRRFPVLAAA